MEYAGFIREDEELGIQSMGENGNFQFILDGQQRLISLFVSLRGKIMSGTDYGTICFNPLKKEFKIPRSKREKFNIPAWKLFDNKTYGEVYAELLMDDQKFNKKTNLLSENWRFCQKTFSNYPISIVKTSITEIDDVVEIFERINQGGKHLTIFDLIHATTWSDKFDMKERIDAFNNPDRVKRFGVIANKVFTHSLTLNAFDDARNAYQLKLSPEMCYNLWPKTVSALSATLDFLKSMRITSEASVYHNMFPVLQYYFFRSGSKTIQEDHKKIIEKWFWDAKFSKRYQKSVYTRIKEDAQWILSLIED